MASAVYYDYGWNGGDLSVDAFSAIGVFLYFELVQQASSATALDVILPNIFLCAAIYLPIHIAFFRGLKDYKLRNVQIFYAFREAGPSKYLKFCS